MHLNLLENKGTGTIDKTVVFLALCSVFFFTYIPFLYVFDFLGVNKILLFLCLVVLTICILVIRVLINQFKINKSGKNIFILYQCFSLYALMSFAVSGNQLNDIYNIRTITIINSIMIVFSLSITNQKELILKIIFYLTSVLLILSAYSLLTGSIDISGKSFQNIDVGGDAEGDNYQNINMYLGLFAISSIYFIDSKSRLLRLLIICLITFSLFMTFIIGGRGGVVALAFVFILYIFLTIKKGFKNITIFKNIILYLSMFSITYFIFRHEISNFIYESLTFNRLAGLLEGGDSSSRIYLFTNAIELFLRDGLTFLFGAGINSYPAYIGSNDPGMYPHNILLELLAEFGLIGLSLFLSPVIYVLCIRKKRLSSIYGNSSKERLIFMIAMYFWVLSSFTGGLRTSWLLLFFTFLLLPANGDHSKIYKLKHRLQSQD